VKRHGWGLWAGWSALARPLALGMLALLAGCALPGARPTPEPAADPATSAWETRVAALTPRAHFGLRGRIAIQRGAEGAQAQLSWTQRADTWDLRLVAPLGQGSVRLEGMPGAVVLSTPDGARYRASDVDALMKTHLRWSLPVAGARYWILGLPVPGHPVGQLSLDAEGRLRDLAQDGWRISVLEYQNAPAEPGGLVLPRRLFLLGKDVQLRIVITAWTASPH
jgi:outer membrane lipoprotein LolB